MSITSKKQNNLSFKMSSRTHKRRNNSSPWSKYDLQRLTKLYPRTHNFELARMFGRTEQGVRSTADRLGLRKKYNDEFKPIYPDKHGRWTKREIDILKKMYLTHTFEEISDVIDRTRNAISQKLQHLKLKKYKFWTKAEDVCLRRFFITKSAAQLGEELGRTRKAILSRARTIGLERKYDEWTNREIELLKKYYNKMNCIDLAKKLERTTKAVSRRIERLGLVKRKKWNDVEKRILKKEYKKGIPVKEIAEMVNRSKMACLNKIRTLNLRRSRIKGCTPKSKRGISV